MTPHAINSTGHKRDVDGTICAGTNYVVVCSIDQASSRIGFRGFRCADEALIRDLNPLHATHRSQVWFFIMQLSIARQTTPYFYGQREAYSYLRSRRWRDGFYCPRCGSKNVREVRTDRILETFSCRRCQYNYTTLSDTHFHGSKIVVSVKLQLVAMSSLVNKPWPLKELADRLSMSTKTVTAVLTVLERISAPTAVINTDQYGTSFQTYDTLIAFLEQPTIFLDTDAFGATVDQLLAPTGRSMRRPGNISPR